MKRNPSSSSVFPRLRAFAPAALAALSLLCAGSAVRAQCVAPASWFPSSQTKPFDPSTFPDNTTATNCDFHLWAWQTFMWLTQDVNGQPRFTTFPSDTDLFDPKAPDKAPQTLSALMGKPRPRLQLKVRADKSTTGGVVSDIDEITQAGGGGILVDQKGNPVYYSVNFDPVFYNFVQSNQYYDYDKYIAAPPATDYPYGAIELKASWKIVADGDKTDGFFVINADVPVLAQDSSGVISVTGQTRPVKVALVGLHVVGIVANHPEFIWATFEQNQNAPDLPAGMDPNADKPVSDQNYSFYAAGTLASKCNKKEVLVLDADAQTISPETQVYQLHPGGGGSAENLGNIAALNDSVHKQLQPGETLQGYKLGGAVWLLPGALQPNMPSAGNPFDLHGSTILANTTMETYHQTLSCFTCHTTQDSETKSGLTIPPMNMNLSHKMTDGLVQRKTALLMRKALEMRAKEKKSK